ncbi:MAG TPA: HD domain-containing protein [Candidatus Margulisiibacteriota bacterium]|nr:HD domain-containing protein [Candidatus Margulisiibacteriota bacterium]
MKPSRDFNPKELALFRQIDAFANLAKVRPYLVGGTLRDLYLKRRKKNPDFDFALEKGGIKFAKNLSRKIKAGFVVLDEEHGASRLVMKSGDIFYTLDFTDFRGKDLEEDLLHRDFSINSLALELEKAVSASDCRDFIIDPYGGRKDLKDNLIKAVNRDAFSEDPLRILRAFGFSSLFNFKIEKKTLQLAIAERKKLSSISGERIRDELFRIFSSPHSFEAINSLDKSKILELIIPEIKKMRGVWGGPYHHLDLWKHTLESLKQLEGLFLELKNREGLNAYLDEYISAQRSRRQLLKLAMLLHDIGKPKALRREGRKIKFHGHERIGMELSENISERLKLSNEEARTLKAMVLWHLRPGYLADSPKPTSRAVFRYFRDAGTEAASILLLSVADQRATKGRLSTKEAGLQHERICFSLVKEYFRKAGAKKRERLITGDDLIRSFKLEPSPLIGKILRELEELQGIKKISTKREALAEASRIIKWQRNS